MTLALAHCSIPRMGNTHNTAAQTNDTTTKKRRSPEELARYHREQTRKNEERFAAGVDLRVAQAATIVKKLEALRFEVNDGQRDDLEQAILLVAKVHKSLTDAAIAEHLDADPDFEVKT